jgi:hypothetical protein
MSPNTSSTHETSRRPDDPNSNLDDHVQTIGAVILYFMLMCVLMLVLVCLRSNTANLLDELETLYAPIVIALVGIWGVVLFSLTIELDLSHMPLWLQRFLHVANVAFFILNAFVVFLRDEVPESLLLASIEVCSMSVSAAVFYILCAAFYRIYGTS